jgi:predicted 3-demethylubiquinone-9 3-methyltransferase (glyoxalase superfamily)
MTATFQLDGQEFFALNGSLQFTFSPAISFFVNCETQQEVDELWKTAMADAIIHIVHVQRGIIRLDLLS